MNTFVTAMQNRTTTTTNGMVAQEVTGSNLVDFFFKVGALRRNPDEAVRVFVGAYAENKEVALRTLLWSRDIRGGAGEREIFRRIIKWLDHNDPQALLDIMEMIPEVGRWDDLLVIEGSKNPTTWIKAVDMIAEALEAENGLAAKWMPRKGPDAIRLRNALGLTPKQYRKSLVYLSNVVETQMCAKNWHEINFSHVPSLAAIRYKNAFTRNAGEKYREYLASLERGDKNVKVNAGAVYPYDVVKTVMREDTKSPELVKAQWEALPDFVGDNSVLAVVDTSGSMTVRVSKDSSMTALEIAVSLGLYVSDKNTGVFKDMFVTFSEDPKIEILKGDIVKKINQLKRSNWGMSTNLEKVFTEILRIARQGNAKKEDMPKTLLIMSDMQFNSCIKNGSDRAIDMIRREFEENGYDMPRIVFWNLVAYDNVPVNFNESGVALVSGFSPSVLKSVLSGETFDPMSIMLRTVMSERYNYTK